MRDGCRGTINPGPKKYKILNGHYLCLQPQCTSEYPEGAEILNTYSTREKFWKHIESVHSHPEDLLYTCDHCGKKFALKGMLKDHVVKVHDKPVRFNSNYNHFIEFILVLDLVFQTFSFRNHPTQLKHFRACGPGGPRSPKWPRSQ